MRNILILDDDLSFCSTLQDTLGPYGLTIQRGDVSEEALGLANEHDCEALVIAVDLPDKVGFALCHRAKKHLSLPIVLTTKSVSPEGFEKHRQLKAHADAYFDKRSFSQDEFLSLLRTLIPIGDPETVLLPDTGTYEIPMDEPDIEELDLDDLVISDSEPMQSANEDPGEPAAAASETVLDSSQGVSSPPGELSPGELSIEDETEAAFAALSVDSAAEPEPVEDVSNDHEPAVTDQGFTGAAAVEDASFEQRDDTPMENASMEDTPMENADETIEPASSNEGDLIVGQTPEDAEALSEPPKAAAQAIPRETSAELAAPSPSAHSGMDALSKERELLSLREQLNRKDKELLDALDKAHAKERLLLDEKEARLRLEQELLSVKENLVAAQQNVCTVSEKHTAEMEQRKAEHEQALVALRNSIQSEVESKVEEAKRDAEAKLSLEIAKHRGALQTAQEEAATALNEATESHRAELAEHEAKVRQALEGEHTAALAQAEEAAKTQLKAAEQKHQEALAQAIEKAEARHKEEVIAVQQGQEDAQNALRAEFEVQRQGLINEHAAKLEELASERDSLQTALSSSRKHVEELEASTQAQRDDAETKVREAQEHVTRLQTEIVELEGQNATIQDKLVKAYQKIKADEDTAARAKKAMAIALTLLDDSVDESIDEPMDGESAPDHRES